VAVARGTRSRPAVFADLRRLVLLGPLWLRLLWSWSYVRLYGHLSCYRRSQREGGEEK